MLSRPRRLGGVRSRLRAGLRAEPDDPASVSISSECCPIAVPNVLHSRGVGLVTTVSGGQSDAISSGQAGEDDTILNGGTETVDHGSVSRRPVIDGGLLFGDGFTNGTQTVALTLAGDLTSDSFAVSSDGSGGTTVTDTTPGKIRRSDGSAATSPPLSRTSTTSIPAADSHIWSIGSKAGIRRLTPDRPHHPTIPPIRSAPFRAPDSMPDGKPIWCRPWLRSATAPAVSSSKARFSRTTKPRRTRRSWRRNLPKDTVSSSPPLDTVAATALVVSSKAWLYLRGDIYSLGAPFCAVSDFAPPGNQRGDP